VSALVQVRKFPAGTMKGPHPKIAVVELPDLETSVRTMPGTTSGYVPGCVPLHSPRQGNFLTRSDDQYCCVKSRFGFSPPYVVRVEGSNNPPDPRPRVEPRLTPLASALRSACCHSLRKKKHEGTMDTGFEGGQQAREEEKEINKPSMFLGVPRDRVTAAAVPSSRSSSTYGTMTSRT